jgi:perosamine synthetase
LHNKGIGSRPFYPSLHSQLPYSNATETRFHIASNISGRGLWLPSSLKLTDDDIDNICKEIKNAL